MVSCSNDDSNDPEPVQETVSILGIWNLQEYSENFFIEDNSEIVPDILVNNSFEDINTEVNFMGTGRRVSASGTFTMNSLRTVDWDKTENKFENISAARILFGEGHCKEITFL